jgi:hypothetical protein
MDNCNNIVNICTNFNKHSYSKGEKENIISSNSSILYPKDELNKKLTEEYYKKNKMVTFKEKYDKDGNILSVTTYITPYPTNELSYPDKVLKSISNIYETISSYF